MYTLLTHARAVAENSARDLKEKLAWWLPAVWSLSSMVAFDVLPTSCHVTRFASGSMVRLACGRAVTEMSACCRRISASPTAGMNSSPCGCSSSTHPEASAQKALADNLCAPVRAQRALRHPICHVHLGIIVPVIVIVILMKKTDTNTSAHTNTNINTDMNTNLNTNTNAKMNTTTNTKTRTNMNTNINTNMNTNANTNTKIVCVLYLLVAFRPS